MGIGAYKTLSLADARKSVKLLAAQVALGHDVAGEKQDRKRKAVAEIQAAKGAVTVGTLADEFFAKCILGRWKHPNIVKSRIENDIKPAMGSKKVKDVRPGDIDALLQRVVRRGAPTVANDVLRWCKRIFNFGIKRHYLDFNPAGAFDNSDAGGKEVARDRWLTREELMSLFNAMRDAEGRFVVENRHAVWLLLLLGVRKEELIAAPWKEFDLEQAVWHLPAERAKTGIAIDIPLPPIAVGILRELLLLASGSKHVFPARKQQTRMIPHICENTLNAALGAHVRPKMAGVPHFTIHDLRHTARTHIGKLGAAPHIAERCINHKVDWLYDHNDYFDERKKALTNWAKLLVALDSGRADYNVTKLKERSKG